MGRKSIHELQADKILAGAEQHEELTELFRTYIIEEMSRRGLSYDRAGKLTDYSSTLFYKVHSGKSVKAETLRELARSLALAARQEKN